MESDQDQPMADASAASPPIQTPTITPPSYAGTNLFAPPTIPAGSGFLSQSIPPPSNPLPSSSTQATTPAASPLSSSTVGTVMQNQNQQPSPEQLAQQAVDNHYAVISNNAPGFKYKYPQAAPTPPGEDDVLWNKVYTAADSRMYNKNGKSANNSLRFRKTGETRELALQILAENKATMYKKTLAALTGQSTSTPKPTPQSTPRPTMAPKKAPASKITDTKDEPTLPSRDGTPGGDLVSMSISEKIKSEGRNRKANSAAPSSNQGTPAPTGSKTESPGPQAKVDKAPMKKKGTATLIRNRPGPKPGQKKKSLEEKVAQSASGSRASETPGPSAASPSDSGSNDGGEYCVCRGPDDHRMMVFCEGDCEDWYHCTCVDVDEADARELLDHFICPKCKTENRFTTWKPMCRYYNVGKHLGLDNPCRKAARVGLDPPSKYCSDECKVAFWQFVKSRVPDTDKPSMGGALTQKEVGMLAHNYKTVAEWKKLGQKPRLPRPEGMDPKYPIGLDYITPEEVEELARIKAEKKTHEAAIETAKGQQKLLTMIHVRAKIAVQHPDITSKDICGYDNRLAMNEFQFESWRKTEEGTQAFETGVLGPRTAETKATSAPIPYPGQVVPEPAKLPEALDNICLKPKKCKHLGWREINSADYANNIEQAKKAISKLTAQEEELIEDAEVREATKDYDAHNVTIQLF